MKKTILAVIIVFTLLAFWGCGKTEASSSAAASASSSVPSQAVLSQADSSSFSKALGAVSEASSNSSKVYEICGKSNKLSAKAVENMRKWRADAKAYGEQYPATVFLNDQPQSNTVYLTFDDGPDDTITPKVVDILAENNVCGNFFFVGREIKKHEDVVKKAYANHNFVGSHCFSHTRLTSMTSEQIKKEITDTNELIKGITGSAPSFVRPPYGDINDSVIADFEALNLKIILWSIDTLDWSQREVANIVKNVSENLRPGDIILMHSNGDKTKTAKALPEVIQVIKDKGYAFGTFNRLQQQPN
ncbi:polysaccharide deacetylase family protein [Acetanaerobacterium elongatum]|uniref:Peptidoglycan/xylan/chitin deacetylase, PgdA/CDA1 family n=1 Tax=Acetanaerobacterium elongatum TaxID=258515 RepID=A0A1H0EQV7_9FIRM|nr:polysaccharide deacetylase family protein [Acetanaerobacterium elongatum]SDN84837.1 Peptidoglycan/xylan/chitin deacetylase, PgdA/CDA1 family [Acetanaerobacterium elongatum]